MVPLPFETAQADSLHSVRMRYIDTGTRDPEHALGFWLDEHVLRDPTVRELRWQSGFFDAGCLGYFAPLMARLRAFDGVLNVLIGSNDGMTARADVEALLTTAGPPRTNQQIGIVSFRNGYFHPKTVHIVRDDQTAAAYVGSANLTRNGVTSLHVEAGLLLDTREKDDAGVLAQIARAIDWWFAEDRPGLNLVYDPLDLAALVSEGVLNIPPPPAPRRGSPDEKGTVQPASLKPLLRVPALPTPVVAAPQSPSIAAVPLERWWKKLSQSDAQRKPIGNQRGSITLVRAGHYIDAQTYFRHELFEAATWVSERTNTGEKRESAVIPFEVNILGRDLGVLRIKITYAPNREAAQANYTSLLHLGPLAAQFESRNLTDKWLELSRRPDGRYTLTITAKAP